MRSIGNRMQDVGATMGASFMAGATTMGYALGKQLQRQLILSQQCLV
ncbi:hypothetical protein ACT7CX_00390 [Bacillus cereus]